MNPIVSFIIPVYNVEKYISSCIDSILAQSYPNYEIILVDDGSPDNSGQICDQYALKDKRIKVIHKTNGGLSDARNTGLYSAQGKYVIFLDSDDFWIDKNHLETLLNNINKNNDFIGFNCCYYYPSSNSFKEWPKYPPILKTSIDKKDKIEALIKTGTFPMSACLKIIKKDFLLNNKLLFPIGIYAEDIPWFINLLHSSNSFSFTNLYIYAYRKEVNSSISSSFSDKKYTDLFNILKCGIENINKTNKIDKILLSFWAYEFTILLGMVNFYPKNDRRYKFNQLKEYIWLLQHRINPKVKLVWFINKIIGIKYTSYILHFYIKYYLWK